jgi:hypothetical protein
VQQRVEAVQPRRVELATRTQAISANSTESGSGAPAKPTETRIEKAIAAPGAMCVIDWKRTCGRPIECSRRWSKVRAGTRAASITPPRSPLRPVDASDLKRGIKRTICSQYPPLGDAEALGCWVGRRGATLPLQRV